MGFFLVFFIVTLMFYGDKKLQKFNGNKAAIFLDSEMFRLQGTSGDHIVQPPTQSRVSSELYYTA